MAFQLSPGINVSEVDLTTYVPSVATTIGAFVGNFSWGPTNEIVTIDQEATLIDRFGKPTDSNYEYWFSASNFLAYGNTLRVVRAGSNTAFNATSNKELDTIDVTAGGSGYSNGFITVAGIANANVQIVVGNVTVGNVTTQGVIQTATVIDGGTFETTPTIDLSSLGGTNAAITLATVGQGVLIENETDYLQTHSSGSAGLFAAKYPGVLGNSILVTMADANTFATWSASYKGFFTDEPSTSDYVAARGGSSDELHILVIDAMGTITGSAGTVLEKFGFVSKAKDAKNSDGSTNYYKDVLNNRSKYVWWLGHPTGVGAGDLGWGDAATVGAYSGLVSSVSASFGGGVDPTIGNSQLTTGYDQFVNGDNIDISLIMTGPANTAVSQYVINNIAEVRKDCVVFVSPQKASVVDNYSQEVTDVKSDATAIGTSSYAFMDSGWKYQYDKFNDTYRWVPLNGDIAGLTARSDQTRDPWYSPAGVTRGVVKNVIKLAWNPSKSARDDIYSKGVNPVVTFSGQGTILYGDKTLLSRPSAFDRINVRRLFIVLQKAISVASRSTLFEFNDPFTRSQFVALVEPYLRDVQGRRGIFDFRVVCDESNNTPEIIDRNEFVGDIYIKPSRSVNFIQLNFVAVRTGVQFSEIVGKF